MLGIQVKKLPVNIGNEKDISISNLALHQRFEKFLIMEVVINILLVYI
jgi:hypothetical protein